MATLKAVVRTARADGFYPVYIRVTHHRSSAFIKTDKMVTKKELTKTNEIKDPYVLQFCSQRILEYTERLNSKNIEHWTVKEVVEFLASGNDDVCFSDYARKHINRMIDNGQQRNAKNYQLALQPVILLTAKTDENDHTEGYLRGADAYITKPFNAKNLELLVQNIQKSRKQSIEHFKQAEELNIKQITNNPRDEIFMKELMELIMANLTKEDFGVTEITAHLRISRSLLHMKLKSLTGCSITQFIRTIKMKEAKTHLLNGMNVSEASFAVGISDPNYFTKCFKKEFNITPTEFLKQLK